MKNLSSKLQRAILWASAFLSVFLFAFCVYAANKDNDNAKVKRTSRFLILLFIALSTLFILLAFISIIVYLCAPITASVNGAGNLVYNSPAIIIMISYLIIRFIVLGAACIMDLSGVAMIEAISQMRLFKSDEDVSDVYVEPKKETEVKTLPLIISEEDSENETKETEKPTEDNQSI